MDEQKGIIMEPESFGKELLKLLKKKLRGKKGLDLDIRRVVRRNDVVMHSINVFSDWNPTSENFYLEDLYKRYQGGGSLEDMADKIVTFA